MTPRRLVRRIRRELGRRVAWTRGTAGPGPRSDVAIPTGAGWGPSVLVIVIDGLRPDRITMSDTPTLHRLRSEGVWFADARAVAPTGTRVNAAAISTGAHPARNGILGNAVNVRGAGGARSLRTQRLEDLERAALEGEVLTAPTLASVLADRGRQLVALSSASTGSAWLLAPEAAAGAGAVVNGAFGRGERAAYPDALDDVVRTRFGPAPRKARIGRPRTELVRWTDRVLSELVLPELRPDVTIAWICEPDHTQHAFGVGSPQARRALAEVDGLLGDLLARLAALGLEDRTDLLVLSDHGGIRYEQAIDVGGFLVASGLKLGSGSPDVLIAPAGPSVQISIERDDPARLEAIVSALQAEPWCGPLFSRAGEVAGTFPLELVHLDHPERSCDLLITFGWDDRANGFGVAGTGFTSVGSGRALHSGHGGLSPYEMRTTFLARGPSFRDGHTVSTPVGHVDVVPTVLEILGIRPTEAPEGRVLTEALRGRADPPPEVARESFDTMNRDGSFHAALQASVVDGRRYLDAAWRATEPSPRIASSAG